jgi:hypothetical protein
MNQSPKKFKTGVKNQMPTLDLDADVASKCPAQNIFIPIASNFNDLNRPPAFVFLIQANGPMEIKRFFSGFLCLKPLF